MDILRRVERSAEAAVQPVRPYVPALSRFLLVATFFEDSWRICSGWDVQMNFMVDERGLPIAVAASFLVLNVVIMLTCSTLAILRKHVPIAITGLVSVLAAQCLAYRLYEKSSYLLRAASIAGALLMLLADSLASARSHRAVLSLLPPLLTSTPLPAASPAAIDPFLRRPTAKPLLARLPRSAGSLWLSVGLASPAHVLLAGRVLLVTLCAGFIIGNEGAASPLGLLAAAVALAGAAMVVVGFRVRSSAVVLVALLAVSNVAANGWWTLHHEHPERDFQKFDFFQTLSVLGGFLLLLNLGPGGLSVDEKKKSF
ncbi:SURF4 family-domain-containing protein [Zopfochytrium polystomum]|nr:SURF4 family-domain-containing protein [Zopfochytrium polystomum]